MIPVLNKKTDTIPKLAVFIGRPSVYGNPFSIRGKLNTREVVIQKFRAYFLQRVESDLVFRAAVEKLRTATALVCFCAPKPCHGDIIAEWLERNP